jgi:hypothetical protein
MHYLLALISGSAWVVPIEPVNHFQAAQSGTHWQNTGND